MSRKVKSLLEKGPQFPERFDTRDFSVEVLLKGGWPVAIEYELEPEATASVIVTVKGAQPFSLSLPATGTGQPRATSFILPNYFGDQLLPAKISFKAEKKSSAGRELAQFELYVLAIGPDVVKPANPNYQQFNSKNQFATASDSFQAAHHSSLAKAQRSAVVDRVIFDRPGINVSAGEVVAYSFQPAADFQKWSATFFSFSASSMNQRAVYEFRELISQSTLVRKTWNGKNERNRLVPAGIYKVLIRAWRSAGGQSASASSQQNIRVN